MLKIRITDLKGVQDEVVHEVVGDEAIIGRAPSTDVVIANKQVSGRHAKILTGIVVVDLDSTNGVFVRGTRVQAVTAVKDGKFLLGKEIAVHVESVSEGALDAADDFDFEPTLVGDPGEGPGFSDSSETTRAGEPGNASSGEASPSAASDGAELAEELERQRSDNEDLRRRLASLKADIEAREVADSGSPQARLAHDAMRGVAEQNEVLQARILELEKEKGRADVEAAKGVLEGRVAELESLRADLMAETESLRSQLEAAERAKEEAAQAPSSDIFFKLQQEIQRLKDELSAAKGDAGKDAPDADSGTLFFELREENARLRKELKATQSSSAASAAAASAAAVSAADGPDAAKPGEGASQRVSELERALEQERAAKAETVAELAQLRRKAEARMAGPAPAVRPGSTGEVTALLERAAEEDVDQLPSDKELPSAEFLSLELFRFVRHSEKVITRLAGGLLQIYNPQTVLAGAPKTLRELTLDLVNASEDPGLRVAYTDYLDKLKEWLAVAIQVYPRAAESYAMKLRDDLSEDSLTKKDPIPRFKRMSGHADGELWLRATKVLGELSDETVRDGVERLARGFAVDVADDLE